MKTEVDLHKQQLKNIYCQTLIELVNEGKEVVVVEVVIGVLVARGSYR